MVMAGRRQDAQRRQEVLDAAFAVLAERGYRRTTMLEIARRASASKETLYAWFGNKQGLFAELILRNAEGINGILSRCLDCDQDDLAETLEAFGSELLKLLLGAPSLVINRTAMAEAADDPTLGRLLLAKGRDTALPKLARFFQAQQEAGRLDFDDVELAIDSFMGLLIGDLQQRRLLGGLSMPNKRAIEARAKRAVRQFLILFGPKAAAR